MNYAFRKMLFAATVAISSAPNIASADGGSISIAVAENPQQLDPMRSANAPDILLHGQLYARLLHRDSTGTLSPGLAESWTISEDGKTYVFTLRDAVFADGSPITAEDVVFSLDRTLNHPESAYPAPLSAIESLEAKDAKTVSIALKSPNAPFLGNLEVFNASIVSKTDVEARGEEEAFAKPLSSGAFMVDSWDRNSSIQLVKNPKYYRDGAPNLDSVEYRIVEDANTRVSLLKAGEVNAVEGVPYANIAELRDAGFEVPLEASTKTQIILMNHDNPPFDDVRVRQAAVMALDRVAIAKAVTQGLVTEVANSSLPGALNFHSQDDAALPYDPAQAKALLEDAGAVGAEVTIIQVSGSQVSQQIALLTQALWSQVGLNAKIEQLDSAAFRTRRKTERDDWHAAPAWYYNETLDPDLAVRWAVCGTCGSNAFHTGYRNETVDTLTEEALSETDVAKRAKLYAEIQQISTNEVVHIPLYYPPFTNAYASDVEGLFMTPAFQWTLEEAKRK
ncbi:ABC transporter substrate-binding protein [Ruegeria atlantica]|uniref:ABC transporter substrate-binding protein n=1 Tax=Ruegeria atlantica TaxID=81569 RepID=UPI00147E48DB|nr:ABC transporter substrate-binding protein [Ruegeria atlantica]